MLNPFNTLYEFFKTKRVPFLIFVTLIILGSLYLAKQLHLEENISKMLPADEKLMRINNASQEIKFMDKLIFAVSLNDSAENQRSNEIIEVADSLVSKIETQLLPDFINDVVYKISDNTINELYDLYFQNLPIFIDESDYEVIEQRTSSEEIEKTIQGNFKTLISPASVAMRKYIVKDPLHFAPLALEKLKSLQIDSKYELYNNRLFSQDRNNLIFFVNLKNSATETGSNAELLEKTDQIIEQINQDFSNADICYYGAPAVAVGNAKRIKTDIALTLSIALGLLIVFMTLFFRKKSIFLILFLPAVFGGSIALAVLYLVKSEVSAISLAMGSVLLGITVDYALHLFTHYRSVGSIKKTLGDITIPVLMSCLTTVSAFLCLMFVSSEALHDMGMFAAISVFSAALFSIVVLPHFIGKKKVNKKPIAVGSFITNITSYDFHKKKYLILFIIVFTIISAFFARKTQFEGDMEKMSYMSPELKKAEDLVAQISDATLKSAYIITEGKDLNDALEKNISVYGKLHKLKEDSIVESFVSVNSILKSKSQQEERIAYWNNYWNDIKANELEKNLLEAGKTFKFQKSAFNPVINLVNKDLSTIEPEKLLEMHQNLIGDYINIKEDKTTIINLVKLAEEAKPELYAAFEDSEALVFDNKNLTDKLIDALQKDFRLLVNYSLIVVFLILLIAYGRIELALLTFIPMAISWLWTLGIMGIFGIKFTIFNIIVSTFIFGLGIDYSIFIMRGLLQEYKYGDKNLNSYKTSILLSAITTIAGIGVLIFAKHPALKSMALLSIIGITSVIIVSYTIEPMLFNWLILNRKKKNKVAFSFLDGFKSFFAYSVFSVGAFTTTIYGFIVFNLLRLKSKTFKKILHYMIMYSNMSLVYSLIHIKKRIINPKKEKFKKPAVIIANHQSHIDLVAMMMLHPKILFLTNDWVQNDPIYGKLVQMADFYPVSMGYEEVVEKLRPRVEEGYSVMVFPEGTRSVDLKMKRFHKGAFHIAEKLNLDILPIILHGTGHSMTKGDDLLLKDGTITIKFLDRITPDDKSFGENYSQRAKQIGRYFRAEYQKTREEIETCKFFRDKLVKNYIFKGPFLEWYMKVKIKFENNYQLFHELTPRKGKVYDIGCGYGFMTNMLKFTSEDRNLVGIDYDCEKIRTAQNSNSTQETVKFECADITQYEFEKADTFIMSDVLHYLHPEKQQTVINNCIANLNDNGLIMIRDGNTNLKNKHKGTEFTEIFSTKVFGFNKTATDEKKLYFISQDDIQEMISDYPELSLEVIDHSKRTSNVLYIIRKN